MKPERVEQEILLLVEGKDACNFFDALRRHLNLVDFGSGISEAWTNCARIWRGSCQRRPGLEY